MAEAERHETRLPLAGDFIERCAQQIVADCRARLPDLSSILVVLPGAALAPALRRGLASAAGRALLLPRIATLTQLAAGAADGGQTESQRQLALYQQLRERGWFADGALWELCSELIELFDELSERALGLPEDEDEFRARLERAYRARDSHWLRFEAEVVHRLWRAEAAGPPGRPAARAMALARLAAAATGPLYLLCDGPPRPLETAFSQAWSLRQTATVFQPQRALGVEAPLQAVGFAWPVDAADAPPLAERAAAARAALPDSPLAGRLRLIGAVSLEAEAAAVVHEVERWLGRGCQSIALVAADRLAARRARALLERDGVLVQDESGWKLSTTRAAALVDAWLEVLAADAYHRDLLDLVKSPFIFGDLAEEVRQAGLLQLEEGLVRHNLAYGLDRYQAALAREEGFEAARVLLARLAAARRPMPRAAAAVADWLAGLERALDALGALESLAQDAAGASLLELLRARRAELAAVPLRLTFAEWREWLERELERATFIDRSIDSPVVMTHLAAARLRRFDAAVLIGADRDNLTPAHARAVFGNQAVRAELGLSLQHEWVARLREDLAGLIACCDELTVTWQTQRDDEPNLLCDELSLLSLLHEHAWGKKLIIDPPLPRAAGARAGGTPMPRPAAPQRVPLRLSASAYASLVACPYQFFVRHMLGLARADEVREALEKRDYGEFVHRILWRFHAAYPQLLGQADEALAAALEAISREVFAPAIEENFLEHAWLARWIERVPAYIAWQRAREAAGWRTVAGELAREIALPLDDAAAVVLAGRLDRLDRRAGGAEAVLDYKAQDAQELRGRLADAGEDVQLACYTLLQGEGVVEATYVALDGEKPLALSLPGVQEMARAQGQRLAATITALAAGAALPAHGVPEACERCEARGLCRRDYHTLSSPNSGREGAGKGPCADPDGYPPSAGGPAT